MEERVGWEQGDGERKGVVGHPLYLACGRRTIFTLSLFTFISGR